MVQKRHLTPLSKKGHVTVHKGKGSVSQRLPPGARETLTRDPMRAVPPGAYPTQPTPPPSVAGAAPPIGGGLVPPVEPDADDLGVG